VRIVFDIASPYYWPQYEPVALELVRRGVDVQCVVHADNDPRFVAAVVSRLQHLQLQHVIASRGEVLRVHAAADADWAVFGNGCSFRSDLPARVKTALIYHGIGVKACYYDADLAEFTVRFTEGVFRTAELKRRYPGANFVDTGFAKLDPLLSGQGLASDAFDLASVGLLTDRPTVLYAPTFYPSSIECLPTDWPQWLPDFNIIIKPHMLTWASDRYAAQQRLLNRWDREPNVHVAREGALSLLPFMAVSDVLVSEASSALFEFAALDRPVVWCDFYKLRWAYRGLLNFRHTRRMDQTIHAFRHVGAHASKATLLPEVIREQVRAPDMHAAGRADCTRHLIGAVDGMASARIADYLLKS
jgi:hypothetical protein